MNKKRISIKSYGFLLLKQMCNVSTMWKKDVMLYLNSLAQENSASNIYKNLFQSGFIEEYVAFSPKDMTSSHELNKNDIFKKLDSKNPHRGDYIVVNVTKAGLNYLIDNADKSEYISKQEAEYFYQNYKNIHQRFRTTNPQKYLRELENSHVMNFISISGAKVFKSEKPSLLDLYLNKNLKINSSGYYYSLKEFREFDKSLCKLNNMPLGEEYRSSTASGIFISDKRCLIIYLSEPTTNKIVYLSDSEKIIISKIINYFSDKFDFGKHVIFMNQKSIKSSVEALVLSDSNALIYSMATGKKHGKFKIDKEKDLTRLYTPEKLLLHDNALFSNIYCIPATRTGIQSIRYLINHSINDYDADSYHQIKTHLDLFECTELRDEYFSYGYTKQKDDAYPNMNRKVIYMPVADINTLFRLSLRNDINSDYYERYSFITYPELVGAISHSIRKDRCLYYEIEDSVLYIEKNKDIEKEVIAKKQIYFFSSRNRHKGLIESEYKAIQEISNYHELNHKKSYWKQSELDLYMNEFYAKQEIDLDKIIQACENIESESKYTVPVDVITYDYYGYKNTGNEARYLESKNAKKRMHKKMTKDNYLSVQTYDVEKIKVIKQAAKSKNKSISKYVLEIVYQQALEDIKDAKEDTLKSLSEMRKRYK